MGFQQMGSSAVKENLATFLFFTFFSSSSFSPTVHSIIFPQTTQSSPLKKRLKALSGEVKSSAGGEDDQEKDEEGGEGGGGRGGGGQLLALVVDPLGRLLHLVVFFMMMIMRIVGMRMMLRDG